jgi:hypothetical protein
MIKFKGVLNSPEGNDLNKIQYIVFNKQYTESLNLTEELEEIYNSSNRRFGLVVSCGDNDIICEDGELFRANKLWYINDVCIDYRLLDITGKNVEVLIDTALEDVL